jgi:para-aminobenzoate synthetase / 4-amino-4-deoxychorismate lyase
MHGPGKGGDQARWTRLPDHLYTVVTESPGAVLLETSRFDASNQYSYLFLNPVHILAANKFSEIPQLFAEIDKATADGLHVAGYLSYECGYHFQELTAIAPEIKELPLVWFGVYSKPFVFNHSLGRFEGAGPSLSSVQKAEALHGAIIGAALEIEQDEYCAKILEIKERIVSGDTYQVNFTDKISFAPPSSASAAFAMLRKQQSVAYAALMNVAGRQVLSLSPELFFRVDGCRIVTRPMKGTMSRGLDAAEDIQAAARLQSDEKNRSEHVMIVDLLRNDLGRICTTGSIQVEDIFSVEKYETLLQMTSTVSGALRPQTSYYDIFRSLFPGGSVTGAPKIHTMEIIRELERSPRGVYTGAIGFIAPDKKAAFNVAIRTLVIDAEKAEMGVGGGIVADSVPIEEYRECQLKASFLTKPRPDFQLIETMLWEKDFFLLDLHLQRLESSADYFGFSLDRVAVESQLAELANTFVPTQAYRVRLLLNSDGSVAIEKAALNPEPKELRILLSQERISSTDVFTRHKTTQREIYDHGYAEARAAGFDEVIFQNERGEITEGAISNVFIKKSGKLHTPPLTCGVLPGVFRRHLLETDPNAEEKILTVEDLKAADAVFLCNSVRGLREVKSVCFDAVPAACSKAHT